MSQSNNNPNNNLSHTLVGICAEGSEDWSREFLLDDDEPSPTLPLSLHTPHSIDPIVSSELTPQKVSYSNEEEEDWTFEDLSPPPVPREKEFNEVQTEIHTEEEDWDAELGISDEIKEAQDYLADGLRLVIASDQMGTIEDTMPESTPSESLPLTLPSRCKIASNLLNNLSDYNVVLYPKPPSLYSLKFDKGRKQFPARDFNDWLQIIVSEHKLRAERASRGKNYQWLNQVKLEEKALTLKVISSWSQYLQVLWRDKSSDDELSGALNQFQQTLQQEQSMKILLPSVDSLDDLFEYLCHILRISLIVCLNQSIASHQASLRESQNSQKKSPTKKKIRVVFQFQILLTETPTFSPRPNTNSKQLKNPNYIPINCCQSFHDLFQVIIGLYPLFKEKFAVFELQCLTYYCAMMLENQIEGYWSPKPPVILQFYLKLYQEFLSNDKRHLSVNHLSSSSEALRQGNLLKLSLFCDLFLFVNGYNALTVSPHQILLNLMNEFTQSGNDLARNSESEDAEDDGESEEDTEQTEISGESSDLEGAGPQGHSKQNLSQDMSSLNWKTTNLSWLQPPTFIDPQCSEERKKDEDTTCNETNGLMYKKGSSVSDVFDKEDRTNERGDQLTSNRSNLSLSSDNFTVISSNTSPIASMTSSLLEEILSEEDISTTTILHFFKMELNNIYTLFQSKYPYVSRRYFLKSKLVFSLALMLTANNASQSLSPTDPSNPNELVESYYFECLFLLDRQSKEKYYELSPPILSPFGLHLFDKFADILMKNTKYKFGLTCLESLLFCHTSAAIRNSNMIVGNIRAPVHEIKLIYRRLITVSQFVNDIQKLLLYYMKMLQIAKKENKLNEFVYLLEMISKQLSEIGEYEFAERCMSVVCLLHFGTPLLSVEFEKIDVNQLDWTELPQGFELPRISSANIPATSLANSQSTGSGLWNLRSTTPNSTSSFNSRSGPPQQLTCDSQQLSSLLKLIDIYMLSDRYQIAIEYCLSLLKRKVFPQGRAQILLQLSRCFLKLRKLDSCEATLDRIAYEADEIVSLLFNKQPQFDGHHSNSSNDLQMLASPRKVPAARYHRSSIDSSSAAARFSLTNSNPDIKLYQRDHSKSTASEPPVIVSASALTYVSRIKSYLYLYLRAKCRYLANDPEWAIHWLQIALSVCPKGKWDWRAKIRYLMGKSFSSLSLRCRNQTHLSLDHQLQTIENSFAQSAEEEFINSIALYKKNTDIIKQIKCRNRIIEMQTSRLFHSIIVGGNPLKNACNNKGESILKTIENLCRLNLQQVGDTLTPLELIRTLINCSEISWLQENFALASSAWFEARNLLTITYLQHIFVDGTKKFTSTKDGPLPHPSYNVSDLNNPLLDIPVLAIPFSTGMITKIYDVLSKIIRLGFFIEPSPLNANGSLLLVTWIRLNHYLKKNISPLFAETQFLQKSLASYSRVFTVSSSFPTPDSRRNTLEKFNLAMSSPHLAEEISSNIELTSPVPTITPLPQEQLKPQLTRPILSISRRSKSSSQSSTSFNESVGYILQDQSDIPGIIRQLSRHKSRDDFPDQKSRQIMRSYSDVAVAEEIDGLIMEVVGATSNILLPFEMMRKAMALESHIDNLSKEGLKATESVLQHLRLAGKNALLSNYGEDAKNILSRAAAPGLTLTSEGYFVPGVLDNSSAESLAKSLQDTGVDGFHREDLMDLLKKNPAKESFQWTGIFQEKIDRQLVLFIRLKVFSVQYTEGRISLTELYKKNTETLRRIAKSLRTNPDFSQTERPKNTLSEIPLDDGILEDSSDNIQTSEDDKPRTEASPNDFQIAHSVSFPNLMSESSSFHYATLYPPSCRFVLLIENFLFLYLPFKSEAQVMILKDKVKTLKTHQLKDFNVDSKRIQSIDQLSDCETLSNATHTTTNSVLDPSNGEEMPSIDEKDSDKNLEHTRSFRNYKHPNFRSMRSQSDSRVLRQRKNGTKKKKSGFLTWKSTSSTNTVSSTGLSDGKEDSFFALSGILGRESITPLYPLFYQCNDHTVSDALTSLPAPMEEDLLSEPFFNTSTNDTKATKTKLKPNPSVSYSLQTLGFQNLMFLLNVLMMEESILLVCSPGTEQNLLHISTTLLRLLRPLCWQHLYIPFMQSTMQSIFRKALKTREPFLIGTYYDVVDGLPETISGSLRKSVTDYLSLSQGGFFSDITIVEVESGRVLPSRRMQFAATCTLSPSAGIIPEADPIYLKTLLEKLEMEKERSGAITFKPPLPARYRYEVYLKLIRIMHPDEFPFLSIIPQNGGKKISIRESKLTKISLRLLDVLQVMMCSLFKGLFLAVNFDPEINSEDRRSNPKHGRGSTGSEFSFIHRGLFAEELFVLDLKDDVKPFLQYLFHTRAFKKLVEDISEYKRVSWKKKSPHISPQVPIIYPSLAQLLASAQTRLLSREEFLRSISVERLCGFMTTYFVKMSDPGQPYPFFYIFPYGYEDVLKNKYRKGPVKVKRRWCVLDAQTLTYYKSRSQRLIKDHIRIDPSDVRLITAPYCQPLIYPANGVPQSGVQYSISQMTVDNHRCALEYGENMVMVFRMDTIDEQIKWITALKARLSPQTQVTEMV